MEINREILKLARESRGLNQKELSALLGIEQGTLSKIENEFLSIDNDFIQSVSKVLEYPESFFYQKWNVHTVQGHFRKKASLTVKEVKKYESRMTIIEWHLEKLLEAVELPPINLPSWDCTFDGSPDMAANFLRQYWKVPRGRIENITKLVEDNGIVVISIDLGDLDGFSMFSNSGVPVIFANKNVPGDRFRFIIAHELFHLILHFAKKVDASRDTEEEAHLGGNEFLIPSSEIRPHLTKLSIEKLAELKTYWKVSMQAILVKSYKQLGITTKNQYHYLYKQMSFLGYRKNEPVFVPVEVPTLIKEIIDYHLQDLGYTKNELSQLLHVTDKDLNSTYFDNLRFLPHRSA
ncbi:XRE family transcriptional regulator [Flavobacterium sp.]|uniref:XRE family transcriptional regulator n=1 Tax=Flavobacterium sp. TaxID=239 RepID=UPI002FD9B1E0